MDIDIDMAEFDPVKAFPGVAVKASMVNNQGDLVAHTVGAYLQAVPTDPLTGLAAVPYQEAEELGCFKIDFLHLWIYDRFRSRADIKELLKIEPDWTLLQIPSVVQGAGKEPGVFQLAKHGELLRKVKPRSVIELADCLALIRPQKAFLIDLYLRDREKARTMLWTKEGEEGYGFKKAHAIAYAYVIILQLHIIKSGG